MSLTYLIKSEPLAGTKVKILPKGFDTLSIGTEAIKLYKLPYVTVKEATLLPFTDKDSSNKHFIWCIDIEESDDFFMALEDEHWERLEPVNRDIPYKDPLGFIRNQKY